MKRDCRARTMPGRRLSVRNRRPIMSMLGRQFLPVTLLGGILAASLAPLAFAQGLQTEAQRKELEQLKSKMSEAQRHRRDLEKQASKVSAQVSDLQTNMIETARSIQNQEENVTALESRVNELDRLKSEREAALKHRQRQLSSTLAAMQRLSQQPAELVLVKPDSALNMARSANLLGVLLPGLRDEARQIGNDLDALQKVRAQLEAERTALGQELNRLNAERQKLDLMLGERKEQQQQLVDASSQERIRAQEFAARAKDLTALIAQLEREAAARQRAAEEAAQRLAKRPENQRADGKGGARVAAIQPPVGRPLDEVRGKLPLPVRGRLSRSYGETDSTGMESRGISIEARPKAQVISPSDGRIVFAGPFRGYGQLLIIASSDGYHTLLSGLGRIDGVVGQKVLAGEPVGQMGSAADETGRAASTLYIELRKLGKPINPLPWLAAGLGKVSG